MIGKRLTAYLLIIITFTALCVTVPAYASVNLLSNSQSYNQGMYAVPAPGNVVIDGNFDEWDTSGRILIFPDYDNITKNSNEVSVMYDKDNLYMAFKIYDPTPMNNTLDPVLEANTTWRGDSIQLRMRTDHPIWLTMAYHKDIEKGSLLIDHLDESLNNVSDVMYTSDKGGTKLSNKTLVGGAERFVDGIELAARLDPVEKGLYYIEFKLPRKAIYDGVDTFKAGDVMKYTVETYWSNDSGRLTGTSYKDNWQPGENASDFSWKAKDLWGDLTLAPGSVEQRQYVKDKIKLMSGYFHIKMEVPKTAKYFTVVAENSQGKRVRNVVSEASVEDYIVGENGDNYIVDVLWDGRDEYGAKVSAGEYTFKGISHEGIDPLFDTYYYGPGQIPWATGAGYSAWGSDHDPPSSVTAAGGMVYLGYGFGEGGHATIGLDEDGNKKWGSLRGAQYITANDKYLYAIPNKDWYDSPIREGDKFIFRYNRETGTYANFTIDGESKLMELYLSDFLGIRSSSTPQIKGIAARNDVLAVATSNGNSGGSLGNTFIKGNGTNGILDNFISGVSVLSAEDLKIQKRIYIPSVEGIAFDRNGILYAIGSDGLYRVNVNSGSVENIKLSVDEDFEYGPITVDNDNNVLIFDKGKDLQIKAFDPNTGRQVYTVGKKGGRSYQGAWEKEGLIKEVSSICVDTRGQIWAVEKWNVPRRVSVWGRDGKLIREIVGSPAYSSAGANLHNQDPDVAYIGPVEMKLNREDDTFEVTKICYLPDVSKGECFPIHYGSSQTTQIFRSSASGEEHEYMFRASYGSDSSASVLYMDYGEGIFKPVFAIGKVISLQRGGVEWGDSTTVQNSDKPGAVYDKICNELGDYRSSDIFVWNDLNSDGIFDTSECTFSSQIRGIVNVFPMVAGWGGAMTEDFKYAAAEGSGGRRLGIYTPTGYTKYGAPIYDIGKGALKMYDYANEVTWGGVNMIEGENKVLVAPTANAGDIFSDAVKLIDNDTGEVVWWYKNEWAGVHGSHHSAIQKPGGELIGIIKTVGFAEVNGEKFFMLRGNCGVDYLFTLDGYFVATLFTDNRLERKSLPENKEELEGISLNAYTEGGEPFGGWFGVQDDGKARMTTSIGGRVVVIVEVAGMDKVKRMTPVKFTATLSELDNAWNYVEKVESVGVDDNKEPEVTEYEVKRADDNFVVDGSDEEWAGYSSMKLDGGTAYENGTVKLAWDDENLYAVYSIRDKTPFINNGADFQKPFKTGDVADIFLSPSANKSTKPVAGDERVMITMFDGKPVAVLARQIDSKASGVHKYSYASPVTERTFDTVKIIDTASVAVNITDTGYIVEAKIPLSELDITAKEDMTIVGDVGIVTSNEMGTLNVARICFFNKDTGLVSDLPGEAQLCPDRWGSLKFVK